MDPEPNIKQAVPFFRVSNMEASIRFYVDGLGAKITQRWVMDGRLLWAWLELGSAALMLQEFAAEGHDAWVPAGKVGEGVSINFTCIDALEIYRALAKKGLPITRPKVGNRLWEMTLRDPDGYILAFESPADLPEETDYAEEA